MIVDLNNLPYKVAIGIVEWCLSNKIDTEKCVVLINSLTTFPVPDIEWTLDVPEEYSTLLLLKWSPCE